MGPRPPRLGAASAAKASTPVKVVRRRGPRPVEAPSAPLPPPVLQALGLIVRDMRDVPRSCLVDGAELVFWLRRMANRVEGVGRMRVAGEGYATTAHPSVRKGVSMMDILSPAQGMCVSHTPSRPTPRDLAEAVFGRAAPDGAPGPCIITSRRGRRVAIEIRRARERGQAELPW